MEKLSFNKIHHNRKAFYEENKYKDHVLLRGEGNVLISAPHAVSQVRLGKHKYSEIGSLATVLYLHDKTNVYTIAKTKNNNDDANFDKDSRYKDTIRRVVKDKNIKYLIDFHGLAAKRVCDVNLGTHIGKNVKSDVELFNRLNDSLVAAGLNVSIDQPFMARYHTISSSINDELGIWTIQVEINCSITNQKENFNKYSKLLSALLDWIESIK